MTDSNEKIYKDRLYDVYREERQALIKAGKDSIYQFDKTILTLSAGALGISIAFIDKIAPNPKPWSLWLLYICWIVICISMVSTLISFITSSKAHSRQIEILEQVYFDKGNIEKIQNKPDVWTSRFNISSIICFVFGIAMLIAFSISNISIKGGEKHQCVEKKAVLEHQNHQENLKNDK